MSKKFYQLNIDEVLSNFSLGTKYDIGGEGHRIIVEGKNLDKAICEIASNFRSVLEDCFEPYHKSWEQCAIDFYDNHPHIFLKKDSPYIFYHWGHYTVCFINGNSNKNSRYGVAKRYTKDNHNYRIGEVAAYARAIGQPINELIGYKGK